MEFQVREDSSSPATVSSPEHPVRNDLSDPAAKPLLVVMV
jgi:hypothetical protein